MGTTSIGRLPAPSAPFQSEAPAAPGYRGATTRQSQLRRASPPTDRDVTTDTPLSCGGYVSVQYRTRIDTPAPGELKVLSVGHGLVKLRSQLVPRDDFLDGADFSLPDR